MLRRIKVKTANRSLPGRYKLLLAIILLSILVFAAWQPMKDKLITESVNTQASVSTDKTTAETPTDTANNDAKISSDKTENPESAGNADPSGTDVEPSDSKSDGSSETANEGSTSHDDVSNDSVSEYTISSGDTIAKVLEAHNISFKEVLALTQKYPALAKDLRPGQLISWTTDEDGHLQNLTWTINRKETRIYEQTDEDGFIETIEMTTGEWREIVINGEIGQEGNTTLCGSAVAAGLTSRECHNAIRYLQHQANLNALRLGDRFTFLFEREYINEEHTASRLLAARINSRKRDRYIIYFENYKAYYDDEGKPFTEGFLRIPTIGEKQYRISSNFNPARLHPVTKRIAPHNGTDFAMPTGTPLVAAGDGEIVIARFSPTAGNYVAIRHGKQYSTRYLHMSKIVVRPGQIVKRGDLIGYSGNTGRSTGPHLHYEFLVDNKYVDPMKMTLPRPEGLKNGDLKEFISYADSVKTKFNDSYAAYDQQVALAKEVKGRTQSLKVAANIIAANVAELAKTELAAIELAKAELAKIELSKIELSKIELSANAVDKPAVTTENKPDAEVKLTADAAPTEETSGNKP